MSLYKDHKQNKDYMYHGKVKKWSKRHNTKLTRRKLQRKVETEIESPFEVEAFDVYTWNMNICNRYNETLDRY